MSQSHQDNPGTAAAASPAAAPTAKPTALYDLHLSQGGRMVDFAGYSLPVQFKGIVAEHNHTREHASVFDVSHMGQVSVTGPDFLTTAQALETLLPGAISTLKPGAMRYTVLLNDDGGIEDDLIVTRPGDAQLPAGTMLIVFNAARKYHDLALFENALGDKLKFELHENKSLLALQGPEAGAVLAQLCDAPEKLAFMQTTTCEIDGIECRISRAGYTGEDGFEISVGNQFAQKIAQKLYEDARVEPAGLGARDSLRLEAGLCLYGHDMNEHIDPISAGLLFAIGKKRRELGGFAGAERVLEILAEGPQTRRVGIIFEGRMPVREGAPIVDEEGHEIGHVTSGTFGPTIKAPIAMAYVPAEFAREGTKLTALVRNRPVVGTVSKMPFVPANYARKPGV
ncbi:Aminomethyltransferase (glycine cleavage system T protein) [hydrothermal vent metagenome]|uniref:aminomethyltransferase n=1 Tax=hydrothermal vent metagenome TaxID=652676 RepID=A0A3B0UBG7_9ZZZZ